MREHLGGIYDFLQKKRIDSLDKLGRTLPLTPPQGRGVGTPAADKQNTSLPSPGRGKGEGPAKVGLLSYEQQKEQQKLIRRLEKSVADCEARIEKLEADIAALEEQMATPEGAADMTLYEKHTALKKQLDTVVEEWETTSMELEEAMG